MRSWCIYFAFFTIIGLVPSSLGQNGIGKGTTNIHERMLTVVPLVGAGTWADPKRPMFAPTKPGEGGILGYSFVLSDDGKYAITEFVARDAKAFDVIRADSKALAKFEKKSSKKDDVEKELKKYKKDFDYTKLAVRIP